jgi:hypothetical protein
MLKRTAFALFLLRLAFAQQEYPIEVHLDDDGLIPGSKVKCMGEVPQDFACAILFNVDPPLPAPIHITSVVGGEGNFPRTPPPAVILEISLMLDGTLYTAVYDPPLKRDDTLSILGRGVGVPARVVGDRLFVRWPDGKEAKAKIIRREKINPNRPQPA